MVKEMRYFKEKKLVLVLIALFIVLGLIIKTNEVGSLNTLINQFMEKIQINFLITISKIISNVLETVGVIIIAAIFSINLYLTKRKKESIIFLLVVAFSSLTVTLLKNIYLIQRPLNGLISETDYSFPSGHSSIGVVLLGLFAYFYIKEHKKDKIAVIALSIIGMFIIAFSRLYLNVHWFTDIIGGLIIGSIWLVISLIFLNKK